MPKLRPSRARAHDRVEHGGVVVADDHRPPGADVVDVAVAVDVDTGRRPPRAATKNGSPPTDLNARTGELTPPGISCWARANRAWERWWSSDFIVVGRCDVRVTASAKQVAAGAPRPDRVAASNTPLITATRSAPASIRDFALSGVMPPIATRGTPSAARCSSSAGGALRAHPAWWAKGRTRRTRRSRPRGLRPARQREVVVARCADDRAQRRAARAPRRCRHRPRPGARRRRPSRAPAPVVVDDQRHRVAAHSACSAAACCAPASAAPAPLLRYCSQVARGQQRRDTRAAGGRCPARRA